MGRAPRSPSSLPSARIAGNSSTSCPGDLGDPLVPTRGGSASLQGDLGGQRRPGAVSGTGTEAPSVPRRDYTEVG